MPKPLTDEQKARVRWLHADGAAIRLIVKITGISRPTVQGLVRPGRADKMKETLLIRKTKAKRWNQY